MFTFPLVTAIETSTDTIIIEFDAEKDRILSFSAESNSVSRDAIQDDNITEMRWTKNEFTFTYENVTLTIPQEIIDAEVNDFTL